MADTPTTAPIRSEDVRKRRHWFVDLFTRLWKEKPLATLGGIIVLIMFLTGIFADFLAPYEFDKIFLSDRLDGPFDPDSKVTHILGADELGRDVFSRVVYGARVSMIVGVLGASLSVLVNMLIGIPSGFFGGKFDIIAQRFVDAFLCFPPLILYLTIMAVLGTGMVSVILVLGVSMGIGGSRIVRSAVIGIKENIYVEAARAIGVPTGRTLIKHILPNIMAPVLIVFTVGMGQMILAEATLSFLGFGIAPPTPSWGGMLSGTGRQYMLQAPHMALWPGLALSLVVYGINMFGDGLRDLLDPRLRGGLGRYGVKRKKLAEVSN